MNQHPPQKARGVIVKSWATWKNKPLFNFSKTKVVPCKVLLMLKQPNIFMTYCMFKNIWISNECKRGWAYQLISDNGKKFLAKGKLRKSFWQRFENDYPSLTRKRLGHHSTKRVFACTEAMKWNGIKKTYIQKRITY